MNLGFEEFAHFMNFWHSVNQLYTRNAFRNINMTSCCNNKVRKGMIFLHIKNDMIDLSKYYVFVVYNIKSKFEGGKNYQKG